MHRRDILKTLVLAPFAMGCAGPLIQKKPQWLNDPMAHVGFLVRVQKARGRSIWAVDHSRPSSPYLLEMPENLSAWRWMFSNENGNIGNYTMLGVPPDQIEEPDWVRTALMDYPRLGGINFLPDGPKWDGLDPQIQIIELTDENEPGVNPHTGKIHPGDYLTSIWDPNTKEHIRQSTKGVTYTSFCCSYHHEVFPGYIALLEDLDLIREQYPDDPIRHRWVLTYNGRQLVKRLEHV